MTKNLKFRSESLHFTVWGGLPRCDILRSLAQWSRASEAVFSKTRGEMNGRVNMGQRSSNLDMAVINIISF